MQFQFSKIRLLLLGITGLLTLLNFTSCNSCSNNNHTLVGDDNWQAKMAVQEFFTSLNSQRFESAENNCNKESKNTVRKLSKFSDYFNNVDLIAIDTCILNKDKTEALCDCIYSVDNGENTLGTIKAIKYIDQWLVSYKFDDQNKNIWMYDYSLELANNVPEEVPTSEREYDFTYLENYIANVVNKIRMGATTMYEFSQLDEQYEGSKSEGRTWHTSENYTQGNQYSFDYNLENFAIRINEYNEEDNSYLFQEITKILVKTYGTPFNSLENVGTDYYKYKSFRWFSKSYNEVVQITSYSDFIRINIYSIP